jgi:hypothetical protein
VTENNQIFFKKSFSRAYFSNINKKIKIKKKPASEGAIGKRQLRQSARTALPADE